MPTGPAWSQALDTHPAAVWLPRVDSCWASTQQLPRAVPPASVGQRRDVRMSVYHNLGGTWDSSAEAQRGTWSVRSNRLTALLAAAKNDAGVLVELGTAALVARGLGEEVLGALGAERSNYGGLRATRCKDEALRAMTK
ncbi:hypothetical protein MAJ_00966, partial [Metarhizium majus ARSEF 297]